MVVVVVRKGKCDGTHAVRYILRRGAHVVVGRIFG